MGYSIFTPRSVFFVSLACCKTTCFVGCARGAHGYIGFWSDNEKIME